ncbi:hypothetical protein ABUE31_02705 [Mesorhizobium sp. ZMM04-5]|uniref:Lipoprotein n=1 Tax=Mesorhizobium marinum TaxID=3228790 RepID=A0ABV3QV23_9HYPH
MKKLVLASVSAIALLGAAACSDQTDTTTTQGVPETTTTEPAAPMPADPAAPPATDNTTTQGIAPSPDAGGDMQDDQLTPSEPAPMEPAPAQ